MTRFYSARRALWMIVANMTHNMPFLLSLLWRERRLRVQLPRIAALSLIPSRWPNVLNILKGAVGHDSWRRLQDMVTVPTLRLYGWRHIREWTRQARSRAYLEFLRRLSPRRRRATSVS